MTITLTDSEHDHLLSLVKAVLYGRLYVERGEDEEVYGRLKVAARSASVLLDTLGEKVSIDDDALDPANFVDMDGTTFMQYIENFDTVRDPRKGLDDDEYWCDGLGCHEKLSENDNSHITSPLSGAMYHDEDCAVSNEPDTDFDAGPDDDA